MDIVFLVVGLCLTALAGLGGVSYLRARKQVSSLLARVERIPVTPIARASSGPVAVQGSAEARQTVTSPLSGRQVIAFRVKIADNSDDAPVTLVDTSEAAAFLVVDATGKALVEPADALLLLASDTHETAGVLERAPAGLRSLMARHGHSTRGWIFERSLTWTEAVLEVGDDVYVQGVARREVTLDEEPAGYREAPSRLVVEAGEGQQMIISDRRRELLMGLLRSYKTLPAEWIKR